MIQFFCFIILAHILIFRSRDNCFRPSATSVSFLLPLNDTRGAWDDKNKQIFTLHDPKQLHSASILKSSSLHTPISSLCNNIIQITRVCSLRRILMSSLPWTDHVEHYRYCNTIEIQIYTKYTKKNYGSHPRGK